MEKQFDTLVVVGRFQPFHNAHLELLKQAAQLAYQVVVIVGSAFTPRSPKNPWVATERENLIREALRSSVFTNEKQFKIEYNVDTLYDDDGWVCRVQNLVAKHTFETDRIGIIGHKKDADTTRYLSMFPQWTYVASNPVEILNATDIRNLYFSSAFNPSWLNGVVPKSTLDFLLKFRDTAEYQYIIDEKKVIDAYIEEKRVYKYPIVAVTVDAVVIQSGHILLIKRRASPGKGLWALPGGYFDAVKDDTPVDGILRELNEETCIDVPKKVLLGSIKKLEHFSSRNRSQSGRSITFAAHISLKDGEWKLPKVKGMDDAEKARWFPLSEVKRDFLHDDHFDIISHFVPGVTNG